MPDSTMPTTVRLDIKELAADLEARIARTRVRTSPFPHVVIDDVLHPMIRRALDTRWPDVSRLRPTNYRQRAEVRVSAIARPSTGADRTFWVALQHLSMRAARAIRGRLQRHLSDKYRPLLGVDWRRRLGEPDYLEFDSMLAQYHGVVDLVPHVDHARVVINGFLYLDDPDQRTPEPVRGTMLYRSLGFAWPSNHPIPPAVRDRFLREAKDVEWRDNRLLAYVNGPWSFHGVPRHDLGDGRRRLLMFGTLLDDAATDRVIDASLR